MILVNESASFAPFRPNCNSADTTVSKASLGSVIVIDNPASICASWLKGTINDVFEFYTKAHQYHWNLVGQDFVQYHELFSEIYTDCHQSVDKLAELLRSMGYLANLSKGDMIPPADNEIALVPMIGDLYQSNSYLCAKLQAVYTYAEKAEEFGLSSYLAERLAVHKKWSWKLGASMSKTEFGKR